MKLVAALPFFLFAIPLFGQYGGPAIISRGEAPSAMASPEISIRPFVNLGGTYTTGLGGVHVDSNGRPVEDSAYGGSVNWGLSGSKSWRHTRLGIFYHGGFNRYFKAGRPNAFSETLLIGLTQQLSRHVFLTLRENAGTFSQDNERRGLQQTVPFDPATTYVPTTDFFDNRTYYASTQLDLRIQKSNRLSFDMGGDIFITRRSSAALFGNTGASARGDVQYRLSRHTTVGGVYTYSRYWFQRLLGGTNVHAVQATFAVQFSPTVEFSGGAGAARLETVFEQAVPVPPEIALLLGITSGARIVDSISYHPSSSGRLSKSFHHGVATLYAGQGVTPGNGLFLTSSATNVGLSYGYTGLRRWSLGANINYTQSHAFGYINGNYRTGSAVASLSRSLLGQLHFVTSVGYHRYTSGDYRGYNRTANEVTVGLGWTPGDIPLRVW